MTLNRTTLDLADEVEEMEEQIAEIKGEAADVQETLERVTPPKPGESDERREEREEAQEEWDRLDNRFKSLRTRLTAFESKLEDWGDGEFTIREMTYGEVMLCQDEVQQESFDIDVQTGQLDGVPRNGYYNIKVLETAVVDMPNDPDLTGPEDLPQRIGQWLFNEVDEFNMRGGEDLGNTSLEEAIDSTT